MKLNKEKRFKRIGIKEVQTLPTRINVNKIRLHTREMEDEKSYHMSGLKIQTSDMEDDKLIKRS